MGRRFSLADIDATAGLTAVGGDHPDLTISSLGFASAFANVQGGGETLGKLNVQGTSDLKNLQKQVSQFFDLDSLMQAPAGSHVSLGGTVSFDAHTDGDLTADESDIAVGADFIATRSISTFPAEVDRRAETHARRSARISITRGASLFRRCMIWRLRCNLRRSILRRMETSSWAGNSGVEVPSFNISQGSVDLRLAQEEFGGAMSLFVAKPSAGQTPTLVQRIADNSVRVGFGKFERYRARGGSIRPASDFYSHCRSRFSPLN